MNNIKIFYSFISADQRKKLPALTLFLLIASILEVITLISIIPAVNFFIDPNYNFELNFFSKSISIESSNNSKFLAFISVGFLYLFKSIFVIKFNKNLNSFTTKTISDIKNQLFNSYLSLDYKIFLKKKTSDIVQIIQNESYSIFFYLRALFTIIIDAFLFISIYIFLIILEPIATVSLSFSVVLIYFVIYKFVISKSKKWGEMRVNFDLKLSKFIIESLGSFPDIRINKKENYFGSLFNKDSINKSIVHSKQLTYEQIPRFFLELIIILSVISFVTTLYAQGYEQNKIIISTSLLLASSLRLFPSANSILSSYSILKYRYKSIIMIYEELFDNKNNQANLNFNVPLNFSSSIRLTNLKYRYESNSQLILDNINLKIEKGKFIGVTGESGSGKSTIVKIISGLLIPSSGNILVDDKIITNYSSTIHSKIGYVGQKSFLINESIAENIAFGEDKNKIDYQKIEQCLKITKLEEFVNSLDNGIHTKIGEDGSKLSGGQQKRVSISRALYKDPEILIFDETTSSLDYNTELKLFSDLVSLKGKLTLICVSHNIFSSKIFDQVYELKNKKLFLK